MPAKLLLADDSVTIQRVIDLTFAGEDVDVIAVGDGQQAIDRIDAEPPDVVLADVGMPGTDGYAVAHHVKSSPTLAHIPVVLLTGAFEPIDETRAREVGCDGVLVKPFEPQLVINRVRDLLAGKGGGLESAGPAGLGTEGDHAAGSLDAGGASLDEYFDRLDEAFATLNVQAAPASPIPDFASEPTTGGVGEWGTLVAPSTDRATGVAEPSVSAPPAPADDPTVGAPRAGPADDVAPPRAAAADALDAPHTVAGTAIPLADAFRALLAAEQGTSGPAMDWVPPASGASEELIEAVSHRVLARLGDEAVRQTVRELVGEIAERLVREEIQRIKQNA